MLFADSSFYIIIFLAATLLLVYTFYKYIPSKNADIKDLYSEGMDYLLAGDIQSAYKIFKNVVKEDTNNIKAYMRLGQVIRDGGQPEKALKIHKSLLVRKSLSKYLTIEIYKNLALDYYKCGELYKSIEELTKVLKIDKSNQWTYNYLIKIYRELDDWKKAGDFFDRFIKIQGKEDNHQRALYKIQEARVLLRNEDFAGSRDKFENAILIDDGIAIAYYFIGNSYSKESDYLYNQDRNVDFDMHDSHDSESLDKVKEKLSKAIPMWLKYAAMKPEQSWMVIHLLKDALFVLDRYDESEGLLKNILELDPGNIEAIANLADIYYNRGETKEAIDIIDDAFDRGQDSLLFRLTRMKLYTKEKQNPKEITQELDKLIHFLVQDEGFQIYKNSATDDDVIWLYETGGEQ